MKCFYHSADLDGHCSGAIVKHNINNIELIGINYDDEFPWNTIITGETIYMVDFSLQPFTDMEKLNKKCDFIWIDHHQTAIDEANKRKFIASCGQSLKVGKAACELVWNWFYPNKQNKAVHLLGKYDVWDLIPGTLELQNGLRLHDTRPDNQNLWEKIINESPGFLDEQLKMGKILLKKQEKDNEIYAKSCSFEIEMDGLKCIVINRGLTNSEVFKSVYDPSVHDAMLTFVYRKGKWTITMYSTKDNINVGTICKLRGGGGHKNAAGFQCNELPFLLIKGRIMKIYLNDNKQRIRCVICGHIMNIEITTREDDEFFQKQFCECGMCAIIYNELPHKKYWLANSEEKEND